MSKITSLRLPLFGMLWLAGLTPAFPADISLAEAIRAEDAKYLEAPESGALDESPKIIAGGGEDGLPALDEEISLGPLRVTLAYVEEEPMAATHSLADDMPGRTDDLARQAAEEPDEELADNGEVQLEDIPEEAMLPGEFDLGGSAPRGRWLPCISMGPVLRRISPKPSKAI